MFTAGGSAPYNLSTEPPRKALPLSQAHTANLSVTGPRSRHTPFHSVKVVILGQDPYHNDHQAHGLAFSVRMPTPAPPSLRNMYTCLQRDYPSFTPPPKPGGLLTPWADRGVLLLNTCLTVRAHEANSHANRGWERFTQRIIDTVAARRPRGVVFLAWGTPAGKRVQKVDRARHLVLTAVHPSPLSASRGFFTCRHFRKANEWLAERYGDEGEIDWALVPGNTTIERKSAGEGAKAKGGVVDEEGAVRTVKVVSKVVDVETHGEVMKKDADAGQAKAAIKVDEPCATDHGFEGNEKVAPKEAPSPERGDAKVETEEEGEKSAP